MNKLIIFLTILLISACQQKKTTIQPWILNQDDSSISIIITKNNSVSEVAYFQQFSGRINASGYLEIEIQLDSLETNIPIRNERIEKHLFETELYATTRIHTQLAPKDLTIGTHTISFDVDLHGVSAILQADVIVFEQFNKKVVTLHKPLIIDAKTFALQDGIITLKNIAKLQSINFSVPINFILHFESE
ncbi:hypothetical protein MNBD_GAMMA01-916 [hydrothermal vent metagenome]|uniref:Lipid/polyisoprenoid-binding YceI-like domain-containing protein n=1 Tax=hydrothermal vent metagenome TaxID=652676 RepID=A0A3B0VEY7_9ZZZZ